MDDNRSRKDFGRSGSEPGDHQKLQTDRLNPASGMFSLAQTVLSKNLNYLPQL